MPDSSLITDHSTLRASAGRAARATPMRLLSVLLGYQRRQEGTTILGTLAVKQVEAERTEVSVVAQLAERTRHGLTSIRVTIRAAMSDGVIDPHEQVLIDQSLATTESLAQSTTTRATELAS